MSVDKEKLFASAQRYAERSQWERAIKELTRIVDVEPNDCRALLRIADYTQKMGYPGEALRVFVRVADIYRKQGAAQKALAVLKQAQKLGVQDKKLSPMLADLYYSIGLPHEAMGYYRQSLEYYEMTQDNASYMQTLQMMIRIDSEDPELRQHYAMRLLEAGDEAGYKRQAELVLSLLLSSERLADYVQAAREFLKQYPNDETVIKNIAMIYVQTSYFKEALDLLHLIAHPDRKAEILLLLAKSYEGLGQKQKAVESLKDLARLYESEDRDRGLIAEIWMQAQALDPQDPEVNLALVVGPYGDEVPMLGQSAITAIEPEFHPGAVSRFERPHTGSGQIVSAKLNEARSLMELFSHDRALVLCSEVLSIEPENVEALTLMLAIHVQRGDKFAAAATLRRRAKVLWSRDKDAAIQSVLQAEQHVPRALENFNLLLSFGLDPANYGLSAPIMRPSSKPTELPKVPPMPASGLRKAPPPLPSVFRKNSNEQAASNLAASDSSQSDSTAPPTRRAEVLINNWERRSAKTVELPAPIRKLPSKIIEDLRDIEDSRSQSRVPGMEPKTEEKGNIDDLIDVFNDSQFDAHFDELLSDLFSEEPRGDASVVAEAKLIPKSENVMDASALPPEYMQQLNEALKEVEFYISIGLYDDAETSLNNLVYDYGELSLIKELRKKLLLAKSEEQ
ncbi:MAG: tetratricopeptide repeat protein [Bradymonadales bacterium]